uniref:Uncharacterized protein n=1 Tax=Mustela putorius furo TaxID=9669 RepID=M3XQA7_MUSPF
MGVGQQQLGQRGGQTQSARHGGGAAAVRRAWWRDHPAHQGCGELMLGRDWGHRAATEPWQLRVSDHLLPGQQQHQHFHHSGDGCHVEAIHSHLAGPRVSLHLQTDDQDEAGLGNS